MTHARARSNHLAALLRNEQSAMADFLLDLADFENIRVTCHAHNQLAARRFFGDACIDRYAGRNGKTVAPPDAPALFRPASS